MEPRQKKRIIIFLIFPLLISIQFLTDDLVFRIIGGLLTLIYVGFLIFLRDSLRKEYHFPKSDDAISNDNLDSFAEPSHGDESFEIISKTTNTDLITDADFFKTGKKERVLLIPPDLKLLYNDIVNEEMPKGVGHNDQFTFVLEKLLMVIKESFSAYTAVFFWYNKKHEKLSIEKYVSSSTAITNQKLNLEDDVLSNIVKKEEPELLSNIPITSELDVIRYYTSSQGIRSFVGVPLFFDKNLIGLLAIDSKQEDEFGIETIFAMGRFVRVITILISMFEQNYSEFIAQKRLSGLLTLVGPNSKFEDEKDLSASIERLVQNLIEWDAFCYVQYNPFEKNFKTKKVINKRSLKFVGENLEVDLQGTLVGRCILTGTSVKIDDTSAAEYKRFSKIEDVSFDGSFLAIPLVYQEQNFGVLCFESLKKNAYTKADAEFLKNSTGIISFMIYSIMTQNMLKSFLALDVETKALNSRTFRSRLASDLVKSQLLKVPGSIALLKIDDFLEQESLFGENPYKMIITTVADIISSEMTPLTLFGRLDERLFAIYFFNSFSKDVFLWAEKLRVRIARQTIAVVSKQSTFTVSIGVASTSDKTDVEEVIHNADLALQKALESGGNKVRNIN
ncbi:MAG: GAF domain-containing protein [Ignavibacteria bacterium]|jgi:diguanylate cyclase (GGDEF)-like protein|nr:GAF domain-containing protein [Ignavibacteria bacterium]